MNSISLSVYENRVLLRQFQPKRKELAQGYRTLCNEGLHNLYGSSNIMRVIK